MGLHHERRSQNKAIIFKKLFRASDDTDEDMGISPVNAGPLLVGPMAFQFQSVPGVLQPAGTAPSSSYILQGRLPSTTSAFHRIIPPIFEHFGQDLRFEPGENLRRGGYFTYLKLWEAILPTAHRFRSCCLVFPHGMRFDYEAFPSTPIREDDAEEERYFPLSHHAGTVIRLGRAPLDFVIRTIADYQEARVPGRRTIKHSWSYEEPNVRVVIPRGFPAMFRRWIYAEHARRRREHAHIFTFLHTADPAAAETKGMAREYALIFEEQKKIFSRWRATLDWIRAGERQLIPHAASTDLVLRLLSEILHNHRERIGLALSLELLLDVAGGIPIEPKVLALIPQEESTLSLGDALMDGLGILLPHLTDGAHLALKALGKELEKVRFADPVEGTGTLADVLFVIGTNMVRYGAIESAEHPIEVELLASGDLRITLSDLGIGIRPENLHRLGAERFIEGRMHVERSSEHSGGEGLASLVELLGLRRWGPLAVRSEGEGKGSSFRFLVPAREFTIVAPVEITQAPAASRLSAILEGGYIIPDAFHHLISDLA